MLVIIAVRNIHRMNCLRCPETSSADCAAELTLLCDECGRRIYTDDDEGDDCRVLCRDCRDRYYTRCDRCGTLICNENVYEYDGEDLCCDCYDDVCTEGPIHDYDYVLISSSTVKACGSSA